MDLTWYDLKQMSSWFIRVSCEFIHLASLQRYTALDKDAEMYSNTEMAQT